MKQLVIGLVIGGSIGMAAGYGIAVKFGVPANSSVAVVDTGTTRSAGGNGLPVGSVVARRGKLISFEQTVGEIGVVDQGTTVTWSFAYRNIGDQMLKIGEVTSTCGCTTAEPSPREVPPGGTGLLKVTLMTGHFSGPIDKRLVLRSNDPQMPVVELSLKANIRALFVLEPPMIRFGDVERGKTMTKELLVKPIGTHPVEIVKVGTAIPGLVVETLPMNPADKGAIRLAFKVTPNQNYGPFNHGVRVEMKRPYGGSAAAKPLEVVVHALGTVAGPLRAKPESLYLGSVKPGDLFQPQKLMLSSRSGTPVEVRSIDTGFDGLKAELKPVKPGLEYELDLKSLTALPSGLFHRTVRVLTSASDVPLEISVVGVVTKPPMATVQ